MGCRVIGVACSVAWFLFLGSLCAAVAGVLDDKGLICSVNGELRTDRPHGWYFSEGFVVHYVVVVSGTEPDLSRKDYGPYEEMLGTVFFGKDVSGSPAYLLDLKKMLLREPSSGLTYICDIRHSVKTIQRALIEDAAGEQDSLN